MIKNILVLCLAISLSGCAAWVATPNGLTCSGGDVNFGGKTEASSMSDALRKSCDIAGNPKPVTACCYKAFLFITQTCPIRDGYLIEGQRCNCFIPNGFGYNVAPGVACRSTDEDEGDD